MCRQQTADTCKEEVDECFHDCMEATGIDRENVPPCDELSKALCACNNQCAKTSACKAAMMAGLNCDMEHEFGCKGYPCSEEIEAEER